MKIIALDKVEAKGANFILEKYLPIPENAVTLLSALGGTGKTRLSLIMASKFIVEVNYKNNVRNVHTSTVGGHADKFKEVKK